jgi:hypothetical protein
MTRSTMNRSLTLVMALGLWGWIGLAGAVYATTITDGGGTVPTEASDVYGAWDAILVAGILPIAAIAVGIITVIGSIQRLSAVGVVGGVVSAILGIIGTMALPGIIVASGDATPLAGVWARGASLDPMPFVIWAGVTYARGRRRQ